LKAEYKIDNAAILNLIISSTAAISGKIM